MKRYSSIIIFLSLLSSLSIAQDCSITKKTPVFTSCYSTTLKAPLYVSYKLYNGGGDYDREKEGFSFHGDNATATDNDYKGTGYDKGHLCNAEDFAKDCTLEELTFSYYNALPQTPNLNRGKWKSDETRIRKASKTDSLLIICGGIYTSKTIGNGAYVPDTCWKVVQKISDKSIILCRKYSNKPKKNDRIDTDVLTLQRCLGYALPLSH